MNNSKKVNRTQGEWEVVDRNVIRTKGNGFKFIAKVSTREPLSNAEAEANAVFIVKAVNNHDKLVEALDTLLIQLSPMFNFDFETAPDYVQKAKKLLEPIL